MATSSAPIARTEPPGPASAPAASSPPPNPPIMMLITERFIASAISLVRIAPEAPTRAPAMMSTGLSITKPAIATAVPVNEFSSEITTGMSAPPIGSVIVTPKIRAAARITPISGRFGVPLTNRTIAETTVTAARASVTSWPPGIWIGLPGIRPWSLPDAMIEPVNVIDPMMMSRTMKTFVSMRTGLPAASPR